MLPTLFLLLACADATRPVVETDVDHDGIPSPSDRCEGSARPDLINRQGCDLDQIAASCTNSKPLGSGKARYYGNCLRSDSPARFQAVCNWEVSKAGVHLVYGCTLSDERQFYDDPRGKRPETCPADYLASEYAQRVIGRLVLWTNAVENGGMQIAWDNEALVIDPYPSLGACAQFDIIYRTVTDNFFGCNVPIRENPCR